MFENSFIHCETFDAHIRHQQQRQAYYIPSNVFAQTIACAMSLLECLACGNLIRWCASSHEDIGVKIYVYDAKMCWFLIEYIHSQTFSYRAASGNIVDNVDVCRRTAIWIVFRVMDTHSHTPILRYWRRACYFAPY